MQRQFAEKVLCTHSPLEFRVPYGANARVRIIKVADNLPVAPTSLAAWRSHGQQFTGKAQYIQSRRLRSLQDRRNHLHSRRSGLFLGTIAGCQCLLRSLGFTCPTLGDIARACKPSSQPHWLYSRLPLLNHALRSLYPLILYPHACRGIMAIFDVASACWSCEPYVPSTSSAPRLHSSLDLLLVLNSLRRWRGGGIPPWETWLSMF
jgi:hypothetical protein